MTPCGASMKILNRVRGDVAVFFIVATLASYVAIAGVVAVYSVWTVLAPSDAIAK